MGVFAIQWRLYTRVGFFSPPGLFKAASCCEALDV